MLNKIRKMLKQQEGFTLVELMIVVVILGIISGIGIQQYGKVQENARVAADQANIRIIKSAVQMYEMGEGKKPSDITDLVPDYLEKVPESPWGVKEGNEVVEYKLEIKDGVLDVPSLKPTTE